MWTALRRSAWVCGPILMAALDGCGGGGGSSGSAPFVAPVSAAAPGNCAAGGIAVNAAVITVCQLRDDLTLPATTRCSRC
jgi:hypothetical protein